MSYVKTKGYLINRNPFNYCDEILTFLNEFGNKFTAYSLGVKRINSKNARSLEYGNLLEIELYISLDDTKLSKLKKVVTLSEFNYLHSHNLALLVLNLVTCMAKFNSNIIIYNFYTEILSYIQMNINEYFLAIYVLLIFHKKLKRIYWKNQDLNTNFNDLEIKFSFRKLKFYQVNQNEFISSIIFSSSEANFIKLILNNQANLSLKNIFYSYINCIDYEFLFKKLFNQYKSEYFKKLKKHNYEK